MNKGFHSFIQLFYSFIGLILTLIIITISMAIYVGGMEKLIRGFGEDKKITAVLPNEIKEWSELVEIKEDINADNLVVLSEGTVSLSTDMKTIEVKVKGINGLYWNIDNEKILYGRLIDEEDVKHGRNVIVINEKAAIDLYGRRDVIANKIILNMKSSNKHMSIIGVLKNPIYNNDPICYIPYDIFAPEKYEENKFFLVLSGKSKHDIKSKTKQLLYNNYNRDIKEINDFRQFSFIHNWQVQYKKNLIFTVVILLLIGTIMFILGLENYLYRIRSKLYILKIFGIDDDKIKIKLFNKICFFGLIISMLSIIIGYFLALIIGNIIYIKPFLYIEHIIGIIGFGILLVISAVPICFRKLRVKYIFNGGNITFLKNIKINPNDW